MPAEAGIQRQAPRKKRGKDWIPAFAGMTAEGSPLDYKSTCREPTALQAEVIQSESRWLSQTVGGPNVLDVVLAYGMITWLRSGQEIAGSRSTKGPACQSVIL